MAREYKMIKRIINNFANDIEEGGSGSGDTFSILLKVTDDRIANNLKEDFEIINTETSEAIYTGKTKLITVANDKCIRLDIPNDYLSMETNIDYGKSSKVIRLYWDTFFFAQNEVGIDIVSSEVISEFKQDELEPLFMLDFYYHNSHLIGSYDSGIVPTSAIIRISFQIF